MFRNSLKRFCVARLTSPEFHRQISSTVLRTEFQRLLREPITEDTRMQAAIVIKHALSLPEGALSILPEVMRMRDNEMTSFLDTKSLVDSILEDEESVIAAIVGGRCIEGLTTISKISSDDQFFQFLDLINLFFRKSKKNKHHPPPSLFRLVPDIETEITRRHLPDDAKKLEIVINAVGWLKLSNERMFNKIISTLKSSNQSLTDLLKPSTALNLLRELGWSGLTHADLISKLGPVFEGFYNYQALTSVFIIAGGLPKSIVDECMATVRRDEARGRKSKYPITPEGHCQLIRRLVTCGYYKEAMELFDHFPESAYENISDPKCVSQIHRLFLASFLRPDLVPRNRVNFLREMASKNESSTVTYSENSRAVETSSFIHNLLVTTLSRLGVEHVSEFVDPESLLMIDVYVPSLNLAIEVQGPSHYITDLGTGIRKLRPEDKFKLDIIRARGYRLEEVSVYDFGRNNATRNADKAISQLLAKYSVS